ncbi:MAG: hypothetical protein LAP85_04935 [Acidobacteriia bacterium]|nr:hypothetical protein [Terriglobia bacterium]
MKVETTRRGKSAPGITEMRAEFDFSGGKRGKYAKQFAKGTNIVILDPDVADLFPDSKTVNEALRALTRIAHRQRKKAARSK